MASLYSPIIVYAGADLNAMGPGERSPLGETAAKNFRKVAEILVQYGVNIEDPIPAYNNATPIVVAVFMGSHAVVDLLLRVCLQPQYPNSCYDKTVLLRR